MAGGEWVRGTVGRWGQRGEQGPDYTGKEFMFYSKINFRERMIQFELWF